MSTFNSATQKRAKAALAVAAVSLEGGEQVQHVVCGEFHAEDGVAILTDRRVVIANDRAFLPDVSAVLLSRVLDIKGWADSGRATLRVTTEDGAIVIGDIREVAEAQAFATAVRASL